MLVIFDIVGKEKLTPTMTAHKIGNWIGLPFEVVSCGMDDELVRLQIEITDEDLVLGNYVISPFNEEV